MYLKLYVLAVITLPKEQTNERTKVQPKHEMQTWYVVYRYDSGFKNWNSDAQSRTNT